MISHLRQRHKRAGIKVLFVRNKTNSVKDSLLRFRFTLCHKCRAKLKSLHGNYGQKIYGLKSHSQVPCVPGC